MIDTRNGMNAAMAPLAETRFQFFVTSRSVGRTRTGLNGTDRCCVTIQTIAPMLSVAKKAPDSVSNT